MNFESFPVEVLLTIFEYLDPKSVLQVTTTSKFLHSLLCLLPTWVIIARAVGEHIPLSDPLLMKENSVWSLMGYVIRCRAFHAAWSAASESVSTSIISKISVPDQICMIRILPGSRCIVVVDLKEQARFYCGTSGALVGCKVFNKTAQPEILYSLDFTMVSQRTVLWGLLTTDNLQQHNDKK